MNPVDKIREQRRLKELQELATRPHRKRIVHLDNIRLIGIVANNLSEDEQYTLGQFTNSMSKRHIIVHKIELPADADSVLDKRGLPKSEFSKLFTTYQYDLLIDVTPTNDLFGLYLTLITASNLRVGYFDTTLPTDKLFIDAYDFIIRGEGPLSLTEYLTQILNYLTQIRK